MRIKIRLFFLVTCLLLALFQVPAYAALDDAETLVIKGDGVTKELSYTRSELEAMTEGLTKTIYSATNNFPTEKVVYKEGISLDYLLKLAGIKEDAKQIKFISSDGYTKTFTTKELLNDQRYFFAQDGTKKPVPVIVGFSEGSKGFDALEKTELMFTMGQRIKGEQNNPWFVKYLAAIEVSTEKPEQWPMVTFSKYSGADGVAVELKHPNYDAVKLYYTTDGSNPTIAGSLYNVSASYYQPELNKPILLTKNAEIRAIAVGPGKIDSLVASTAVTFDGSFNDLSDFPWARVSIEALVEKGIINGVGDRRFAPGDTLTRAQFAKMMVLALGESPSTDKKSAFHDIKISDWHCGYVNKAVELGLVKGYPDGTFKPDQALSRQEMLAILIPAMGVVTDTSNIDQDILAPFAHETRISGWARNYVAYAEKFGILEHGNMVIETDQGLSYNAIEKASRAEAAVVVHRMLAR